MGELVGRFKNTKYEEDMKACAICNSSDLVRYPYNNHNRIAERFVKYYIVLLLSPLLRLEVFKPNDYVQRLCNWVRQDRLFSLRSYILRCKKCGYGVYNRCLDTNLLDKYFNRIYLPHPFAIAPQERHNKTLYLEDARAIGQYNFVKNELLPFSKINMLEIGAGGALFSRLVREKHQGQVSLNVVEPADFWKSYYEEIGLKLAAEYFPFASNQKFDYIHASFCLEYVYDLFGALNSLRNLLTENGLLFIAVPNCNSEWFSLDLDDTPRIHFFTKESLACLMEKHYFKVLALQEYGLTHKEECMKQKDSVNLSKKILEEANISIRENIPREGGNCLRGLFRIR